MEDEEGSRYWCHMCLQRVNPIVEIETIKCPICQSGFVEEMASAAAATPENDGPLDFGLGGPDSDRTLSLWAPILLGMMSNPRRRRRSRRVEFEDDDDDEGSNENSRRHHDVETELDRELESIMRRRRRSSATILQLLQGIRAGMLSESGNSDTDQGERDRDGEHMILINPFNQTVIVQGSYDPSNDSQTRAQMGSLGDYFVGPGLDLLLQHLADNDPNRYGTPPAQKEAVEALATVKIEETLQCSVCLDDFEIGSEAKEMTCKHKFHSECLLPWLELHSSCPVCRYQLPSDDSKIDTEGSRNNITINSEDDDNNNLNAADIEDDRNDNDRRFSVPLPWPFSSLFPSSSGSQSSSGNSSMTSPSEPSTNAPASGSHSNEN